MLEIVNPWEFPVKFRLFIRSNGVERKDVDHEWNGWNTNDTLRSGSPKSYRVSMESWGNWYLWVYSCGPTMDLKIQDGDLETGMVTISKGESYFYKESIEAYPVILKENDPQRKYNIYTGWEKYKAKSLTMSLNTNSEQGNFLMYSAAISKERLRNFEIKENRLELDITYKDQKDDKNEVTVEFSPIELQEPESSSTHIVYNIWLCPDISKLALEDPLCNESLYERCKVVRLDSTKNQAERTKVNP